MRTCPQPIALRLERLRGKLPLMYSSSMTQKGISYTYWPVGKDPQWTRAFSRMCLHDQTDCKCQWVFTIFNPTMQFWNSKLNMHKPLVYVTGYYYLRDSGYPNAEGFFTPYRGQRYHLQEWRDTRNALTTGKEYFNMKHSSERNVIKRVFNLLKGR